MIIELPYGETTVRAEVPDGNVLGVLLPRERKAERTIEESVFQALKNPVGDFRGLNEVGICDRIVIVVDDHTRPLPSGKILPVLLSELEKSGVGRERVRVFFATGTHRDVTIEDALKLIGALAERVEWVSNGRGVDGKFECVGETSRGNEVKVNEKFLEGDFRIIVSDVEYHYFAGYGGGRKSILPGVSSYQTVQFNHCLMFDERARAGVLDGNPVHMDMLEAAKLAGVDFTLQVVLNSRKEIVHASSGGLIEPFMRAVEKVDEMYKVEVDERADVVVVAADGYPHDIDLYQAFKAISNALNIVKDGGVIILAAECREGHGNKLYFEWMKKYSSSEDVKNALLERFVIGGHKVYYHLKAIENTNILLVSSMDPRVVREVFKLEPCPSLDKAIEKALETVGKDGTIYVLPKGSTTLPVKVK